jgi:hypothetical protein
MKQFSFLFVAIMLLTGAAQAALPVVTCEDSDHAKSAYLPGHVTERTSSMAPVKITRDRCGSLTQVAKSSMSVIEGTCENGVAHFYTLTTCVSPCQVNSEGDAYFNDGTTSK